MPSLTLSNARIWTADPNRPWARRVCIEDGRFAVVDDGEPALDVGGQVVDLGGRVVTPGFIDTHTHLVMGAESLSQLNLATANSREEFEQMIARRHAELDDDQWLLAHGWHNENWGGAMPDKAWLRAAGGRPCVAYRMDSHICVVNDPVLAMLDLPKHDPPGGKLGRDGRGTPTGLFFEAAAWEIVNPAIPSMDVHSRRNAVTQAQTHLHGLGVTTVGSMEYTSTVREVIMPQRDALTLRMHITLLDRTLPLDFRFAEEFVNDEHLAVIGCKAFIDGTLGSRTARLLEPYTDDPDNAGLWVELAARGELGEWFESVCAHGLQPAMHAIGDAAVRAALDALAQSAHRDAFDTVRPRIEHAQLVHPDDLQRFAGVIASMQPLHRADDARYVTARVGEGRLDRFYPFRRLQDVGAMLAFGSDWPIVSCDPLAGIRAAVTGLTTDGNVFREQETIALDDALRAYTSHAAYALRAEDSIGSIVEGACADLVVFDDDPFGVDWTNAVPRITATLVDGHVVAGMI